MTKKVNAAAAAALVLALAACGDATGVNGSGDATLQVSARGDDAPASQSLAAGEGASFQQTTAQGTIDFRARVYVQTNASGWVELTNRAAQSASVDASGRGSARAFVTSRVNADTYTRVRVVFEEVDAHLSGGLAVSTGLLTGTVSVNLEGDGETVVERQVSVRANAGSTARLLINLNADAWLTSASAQTRTASEAAFASAVRVTAE